MRALSIRSRNWAKWHKGAIRAPDGIDAVLPSSAGWSRYDLSRAVPMRRLYNSYERGAVPILC